MATPIPSNQCSFTAAEIAQLAGATLPGGCPNTIAVSIDSRSITPGALFVALRGLRDGHDYLDAAARAGAGAAVVERGRSIPTLPCFQVDDTLAALGALARGHLDRLRHRLLTIAIGGAAGKTTTKELTAAVMTALCGATLATPGNLNNLIGVPMTLFTLVPVHRAAVIECGTNQRGEIPRLAEIVRPDVALVLNADLEHTEGLGSLEGVADEEAAMFATARHAVVSTAERLLLERVPAGMSRLTFGVDAAARVRLVGRTVNNSGRQVIQLEMGPELVVKGTLSHLRVTLNLLGESLALNAASAVAAAAAALARPLTMSELAAIEHALAAVSPVEGRLKLREFGGVVVIDDTYNSNPRSLRAALAAAHETADGLRARLIVAVGDMLELGDLSAAAHLQALREIALLRPDVCVLVGPEMGRAAANLATPLPSTTIVDDSEAAAPVVARIARPGDVLLVKGSRGIAMERIFAALPSESPAPT
jgi:UDP-N-acetylmuramoyl-tripeptide--D-alanyl-D-alanine ligase